MSEEFIAKWLSPVSSTKANPWMSVSCLGMALTTHPHLALRLHKEYSYISTPYLGLHVLFYDELYLYYLAGCKQM
jgi:hypothetical protein